MMRKYCLMLSLLVVCLLFTILKTCENKEGIIKILEYVTLLAI